MRYALSLWQNRSPGSEIGYKTHTVARAKPYLEVLGAGRRRGHMCVFGCTAQCKGFLLDFCSCGAGYSIHRLARFVRGVVPRGCCQGGAPESFPRCRTHRPDRRLDTDQHQTMRGTYAFSIAVAFVYGDEGHWSMS